MEDVEKNFAASTKALKNLEGLESKVVELEETVRRFQMSEMRLSGSGIRLFQLG